MLDQKKLKEILSYNPSTGEFTWLTSSGRSSVEKEAGWLASMSTRKECKYRFIGFEGKNYLAHRLAFLFMTGSFPNGVVDHINHDGADNRWSNLREVTSAENNRNMPKRFDNKSGICGVWLDRKVWVAKIGINSKQECIGRFDNLFDAVCARKSAEIKHGYHRNHGAV